MGPLEPLLATVKRWKLAWFGHVPRHDSLSKTILQGTLEGGRRRGRQRKCWMDNIKEWTSLPIPELLTRTSYRKDWKRISAGSPPHVLRRPSRSRDSVRSKATSFIGSELQNVTYRWRTPAKRHLPLVHTCKMSPIIGAHLQNVTYHWRKPAKRNLSLAHTCKTSPIIGAHLQNVTYHWCTPPKRHLSLIETCKTSSPITGAVA